MTTTPTTRTARTARSTDAADTAHTARTAPGRARRRAAVPAALAGLLLVGGLTACGDDATVESDNAAPSVAASTGTRTSGSATAFASGSASASGSATAPSSGDAGSSTGRSSGGAAGAASGATGQGASDGRVTEVTDPPQAGVGQRTSKDDSFLEELKAKGISVPAETEDQLIAAANEECLADKDGRKGFTIPIAAGQLQAQGLTDIPPEKVVDIIANAARSAYC
ncbi:DUF732 domain-containing protein [Corynebacterium bovis]|uniref:DUF732 domain-containing protein n=1 Tax=Corynebacterium bovis TaxID=36808 RepID=UPI0031395BF9